jgi:phage terminase large subunit
MLTLNRGKIHEVVAGVDWGFTNPGTIQVWAVDYDGRMYLVHEVYRTRQLIGWWVKKGVELADTYGISPFVCDPSEPAYIHQFRDAGLLTRTANNELVSGIQRVQSRLVVQPDGLPRLMAYRGCVVERDPLLEEARKPCSVLEEMDVYAWIKSKDGRPVKEEPAKINDHGMDAMRYAVSYVDRHVGPQETPEQAAAREQAEAEARARAQDEWLSPWNEELWNA